MLNLMGEQTGDDDGGSAASPVLERIDYQLDVSMRIALELVLLRQIAPARAVASDRQWGAQRGPR
jgi:hypothetical protein